jgi:hypothetical protein
MTKKTINSSKKREQIKQMTLELIKEQKPQTSEQLIQLIKSKTLLSSDQTTEILLELETESELYFKKSQNTMPFQLTNYIFTKAAFWYWIVVASSLAISAAIFLTPENIFPFSWIRSAMALVFEFFLPGFSLIKTLYPAQIPIANKNLSTDKVVRVGLSIGSSIILLIFSGVILNYLPIGLNLISVTLSLLGMTLLLATIAVMRDYQTILKKSN